MIPQGTGTLTIRAVTTTPVLVRMKFVSDRPGSGLDWNWSAVERCRMR